MPVWFLVFIFNSFIAALGMSHRFHRPLRRQDQKKGQFQQRKIGISIYRRSSMRIALLLYDAAMAEPVRIRLHQLAQSNRLQRNLKWVHAYRS